MSENVGEGGDNANICRALKRIDVGCGGMDYRGRKTLNIDAEKLQQAREYLKLDTETEVIDRLLDDLVWERRLLEVLRSAPKSFKTFRSPLATHPPPHLSRPRRRT